MSPMHASHIYQKWNYFRPLDWRHVAAEWLIAVRRPWRKRFPIDPLVARLADFVRAEAGRGKRRRPAEATPDQLAWQEAAALRNGPTPVRVEVEARLLAGQSDAEVAAACGPSGPAVAWYEAAFFNVRDRLGSVDWVFTEVIDTTFPANDDGPVLRWFAYTGGSKSLALALAVIRGRPLPPAVTATFRHDPHYEGQRLRFLVWLNIALLRAKTYSELAALFHVYVEAQQLDATRFDVPRALRGDLRRHGDTFNMAAAGAPRPKARRPRKALSSPGPVGPQTSSPTPRMGPIVPCPAIADLVR
jgi:hypothetical protein